MEVQENLEMLKSRFAVEENISLPEIKGSKRVLIIDDDHDFRQSLKEYLLFHGWEVNDLPSAEEALRLLKHSQNLPDVILLDYLMPLSNGIFFWNALNDDLNLCHLPTIMMTAHEMNSINVVGLRAVVKKPIDTEALLKLMNTLRNEQRLNLSISFVM